MDGILQCNISGYVMQVPGRVGVWGQGCLIVHCWESVWAVCCVLCCIVMCTFLHI